MSVAELLGESQSTHCGYLLDNRGFHGGHQLCLDDIAEVIAENPEVLVVGTGASGLVKVLPELKQSLDAQGIKLIAEPTSEACNIYNQLCQSQRVMATLHLTC